MRAVAASLMVLAAWPAHADWDLVGSTDWGALYIDASTIKPQGQHLKAWSLWVQKAPQAVDGAFPPVTYSSLKELVLFDCKAGRIGTIQQVLYDDNQGLGKIVRHLTRLDSQVSFDDPIPGSVGERLLRLVCATQKR